MGIDEEWMCTVRTFDRIQRSLWCTFYTLGFLEISLSALGIAFNAIYQGQDDAEWLGTVGIVTETIAAILAALVILVPFSAAAQANKDAFILAGGFVGVRPIPGPVIRRLLDTPTLCFQHPFTHCPALTARYAISV